ncbi:MAG: hypothetical protein M3203_12285 [Actinomycetota bacterium]|nr:hypothetical protein [Actinomycetota bacterium]
MAQQAIVKPTPSTAPRTRKTATRSSRATTTPTEAKDTAKAAVKQETRRVKSTAATQARQVKGTATTQTKAVARTANQDVRELAGTVRSQADQVKGELAGQARGMLEETRGQLTSQADMQATRMARAIFQVGSQAVALSEGRPDEAGPLVDYAEQAATWLDSTASYLEERGIEGLALDVADFARRRPGVFLAGAAVLGFGVGRLIRSGAVSGDGNGTAEELEWAEVE